VGQNAPGPDHDGASWQTAYTHVLDALKAAASGDEVWVGPGAYQVPSQDLSPANVPAGVALYGGFLGTETTRNDADRRATRSTISVLGGRGVILSFAKGAGPDTVVDGFTFRGAGDDALRGLIRCVAASPTISHNIFLHGEWTATRGYPGVIIQSEDNAPVIATNIFTGAPSEVIYCNNSAGRIVNNTLAGNGGAAIYVNGSAAPLVANNLLTRNLWGIAVNRSPIPETRNNCAFDNPGGNYWQMPDATGQNGNISEDPRLANYAYGNVHILPSSPCVDAGNDADAIGNRDVDFQPRGVGAHVDIGADECLDPEWAFVPPVVRVSPGGDDANDGSTWAKAKRTVQAATDAASAAGGGEVWVAAGTYAPSPSTPSGAGILLPAYVYVYGGFDGTETERGQRNWVKNTTTLTNLDHSGAVVTATSGQGQSALDGFTVSVSAALNEGALADIVGAGASPIIRHNTFGGGTRPWGQASVSINAGFPNVSDNVFTNAVEKAMGVLVFGSCAPTVQRNVFRDNATGIGIVKCLVCPTADIEGNLFDGNSGEQGIITAEYSARVIGNTFVNNTAETGAYAQGFAGSLFANNVVAFNDFHYAAGYEKGPLPWLRNNDLWESGDTVGLEGTNGNIARDPLFVDAANGDYHLTNASPAVDAGDDSLVTPGEMDLDGNARLQSRHVDIGAYESSAASQTPRWHDVLDALKTAAGLRAATPDDMAWLNAGPNGDGIDLSDAVALLESLNETD
jgi:parallel beta-helix repeat protein